MALPAGHPRARRRRHSHRGPAGGRTAARARCGDPRQNQHPRVRLEGSDRQPPLRRHPKSLGHPHDARGIERRRVGRSGRGDGACRSRHRRGRLHPHPRQHDQSRRPQGHARPRAAVPGKPVRLARQCLPDGAPGRRRGPAADGDPRAQQPRLAVPGRRPHRLSGDPGGGRRGLPHRLQPDPGLRPGRSGGRRDRRGGGRPVRAARRRGRACRCRVRRSHADVRDVLARRRGQCAARFRRRAAHADRARPRRDRGARGRAVGAGLSRRAGGSPEPGPAHERISRNLRPAAHAHPGGAAVPGRIACSAGDDGRRLDGVDALHLSLQHDQAAGGERTRGVHRRRPPRRPADRRRAAPRGQGAAGGARAYEKACPWHERRPPLLDAA